MARLHLAVLAVALFAFSQSAVCAADKDDPPAPEWMKLTPEEFLKRFDKNKDGTLTRDELPPGLARNFDRWDRDSNGKLDAKEIGQMLEAARRFAGNKPGEKPAGNAPVVERRVNDIFERMDANKDGKISKEEARNFIAQNFERIDTNKDGYLDKDELRRFVARNQGMGPGGRGGFGGFGALSEPDFDAMDKNADGRLTREELKGTPFFDRFDEIDANKDGKIDKKEFVAYLKKQTEKKP